MKICTLMLMLLLTVTTNVLGQSAPRNPKPTEEVVVPVPKGLKTKIFEIKNRDPESLVKALLGLSSG
ncbi:MAG: hypothetical protein AB1489_30390, partial [Acidobacteriota bacterium]